MNQNSYLKSRKRLAKQVARCDFGFHDWCEPNPITERTYCRNCIAYRTGWFEGEPRVVHMTGVRDMLGWYPIDHPKFRDGWYPTRKVE